MDSKNIEEVRKRRARGTIPHRLNAYQKTIAVAGVLALFLVIGLGGRYAPFLAAGVVGASIFSFLKLKKLSPEPGEKEKSVPPLTLPDESEGANIEAEVSDPPPTGKEDSIPAGEPPGEGIAAQIQERLTVLEEKMSSLEGMLLSLEGKLAETQEGHEKSAPPIDLQAILKNLDEKDEKLTR